MLYDLHELQHASMVPMRMWATANMFFYGSPFSPLSYNPMSRVIVAGVGFAASDNASLREAGIWFERDRRRGEAGAGRRREGDGKAVLHLAALQARDEGSTAHGAWS